YNTKLDKLAIGLRNRFAQDSKGFFGPELAGKIREIVESQPDTVFISPIVYDNSIWLIWASKGGVRKAWEIKNVSEEELRQAVQDFRNSLARSITSVNQVQEKGKKLYDWLIKPLEGELRKNKIQNLVFALDRQVRYVPMSALYDGEKYLVERYNVSVVPSAALVDMKEKLPPGTQNVSILGLGLTNKVPGFDPLPNVQTELDGIVRKSTTDSKGIFSGKEFFNQAFDFDTLRNNLRGNQILHIATHGEFVSGSADASYIVLGTGKKLPIPEITNLRDLYYVHLVVLSACQTAVGEKGQDGVEINSISSKFLSQGTKAVIASLWLVNDESTSLLMQNFYGNLAKSTTQKHITKAEALHQAQLSLLYNGKNLQANDFSHPYYWAPFILIGNGL
ncbi:MAG: CHAT domain-containing protein, partial [Hassallia sp.]